MGNKGAFIRFEAPDLKPNIVTFSAVVSILFFPLVQSQPLLEGSLDLCVKEKVYSVMFSFVTALYF